jgi:hypothetical protein
MFIAARLSRSFHRRLSYGFPALRLVPRHGALRRLQRRWFVCFDDAWQASGSAAVPGVLFQRALPKVQPDG